MSVLSGWENFYVIVGSSAGALIGLQFVVMTLIADIPLRTRDNAEQVGHTFATPTVVHFGAVLLLSGLLSVPWHTLAPAAVLWGLLGFIGMVYAAVVTRRMRTQRSYRPELEDWLFHAVFPFVAYVTLAVSAICGYTESSNSLFGVACASMLLLFIGIHNAWDAVTYHVFYIRQKKITDSTLNPGANDG